MNIKKQKPYQRTSTWIWLFRNSLQTLVVQRSTQLQPLTAFV